VLRRHWKHERDDQNSLRQIVKEYHEAEGVVLSECGDGDIVVEVYGVPRRDSVFNVKEVLP
jgi:hypothetical protein